jgi:hypothetical protein
VSRYALGGLWLTIILFIIIADSLALITLTVVKTRKAVYYFIAYQRY